ncbi:serpin family protein, partial [Candidatus Saccharibacteria bacterium]|nr:serpin family protein [Candidatus Saccharibacteria bacterium]
SNDGIRAAAATGMGGRGAAGPWDYKFDVPVEEIDLTFDKPFLFLIHDKSTGEVWFTGTVYNPANN